MAVMVGLFTALAIGMVWTLSLRLQAQLREQLLDQAELRALQLSDATAGQILANERLMDVLLQDLRQQWISEPGAFTEVARQTLATLPPGMVTHVTVVNAAGDVVLDTPGELIPRTMADRPHFQQLRDGGDRLIVGEPVVSRRHGRWVFAVGRPILREGRFDGAVYLLASTDFMADSLARLTFGDQDLAALVDANGRILARSRDNAAAMGLSVPKDRPFLTDGVTQQGTYRQEGAVDGVSRVLGWRRMQSTGTVVVVGLSESAVLQPATAAQRSALWLTSLLTLVLGAIGAWIGWLLSRLDQGQEEMRHSRERLQEAQRVAHLGHWEYDSASGRTRWSDEVYRIFGQDPDAFLPSYSKYLMQVSPDHRSRLRRLFAEALALRVDVDDVHRIVRPDGSERWVRLLCHPPRDPGVTGFHGTFQDVTELRHTQLALQRLNAGLEKRVKVRTAELQALNHELESFTYSVSHDLRTPLRSIHGFATLLQEAEADRLSEEGKDFLRRIQESSRRMGQLITDLLSMAQHSRAEIHHQVVDLSAMARSVVNELERDDPQRRVRWDIEEGLTAQADPTLIRVVLQNLLGNAWKYTGQVPQAHVRFFGQGTDANGQIRFCVSDNGAGFNMAYADQLFQPFKRLHAHHEFEGTGIGLATVARVLQRHGGGIRAEAEVGQGALFCFTLPVEPHRPFSDSAGSGR